MRRRANSRTPRYVRGVAVSPREFREFHALYLYILTGHDYSFTNILTAYNYSNILSMTGYRYSKGDLCATVATLAATR
jgi:hypothetical protein